MNARYLIIEGNIGSGKTSLATLLSKHYESELVLEEFAENSFLPRFYENPDRWAFPLELSFLADRYKQLKSVFENARLHNKLLISDYLFDKSKIFAGKTLQFHEHELYNQFFEIVHENIPAPDLLVYLNCKTSRLLENIKKRNREFEKHIDSSYLEKIESGYRQFLSRNNHLNILEIDNSEIDFIESESQFLKLLNLIDDALKSNKNTLFTAF